jgi:hypothetical protein
MTDKTQPNTELLLNGEPYTGDARCERGPDARPRWKRRLWIGVLMIETCVALPKLAPAQFLGVFDSIFSSIQNDIGSSLKTINQIAQQMQKLYQTTVAPLAAINQARGFVANSINGYRGKMNQVFHTPFTSAVTPGRSSSKASCIAGCLHKYRHCRRASRRTMARSRRPTRLRRKTA